MMELEAEVAKLKEMNEELHKKQVSSYTYCNFLFFSGSYCTYEIMFSQIVK